ncbi:DDE-type integrase/transposase/recombinase [Streptomyces sp. NPDC019443]|uniref:DDE-type integrase/transposase/recombinase n=1 Tax=Streptomyces sp. NPDC019443 TaxID=3365061 RepID=UPI003788A515
MDIVGGVLLADGGECKVVTGIDDHSRFVVIAKVVQRATARAVCLAFGEALVRFAVPDEMLTDNGKQFTARFGSGKPGETMFDRICRENGITHRLTRPQSPTTTGKIERFHQTLRRELLDGHSRSSTWWPRRRRWTAGWRTTTGHGRIRPWTWPSRPADSSPDSGPSRMRCRWSCPPASIRSPLRLPQSLRRSRWPWPG